MPTIEVETSEGFPVCFPDLFGERYQNREANSRSGLLPFTSCVICGRDTSKKGESMGVFVIGGDMIVRPEDHATFWVNDGGNMGWFPVGSECIKEIPEMFRAANPYENKPMGV